MPLYTLNYQGYYFFLTDRQAEDASLLAGGWADAVAGQVYQGAADAPGLVALHRLYTPYGGDHFFTTDQAEYGALMMSGYWRDEGVACYVFPDAATASGAGVPGALPVYRAYNTRTGQHFYTTSAAQVGALSSDWAREGAFFYIAPSPPVPLYTLNYQGYYFFLTDRQAEDASLLAGGWADAVAGQVYQGAADAPGLVALHRLYTPYGGDHFFTTDQAEYGALMMSGYWRDEGVACYVFPDAATASGAGVPGALPVYRAYNTRTGQHFYTTSAAQVGALSSDWAREGAFFYIAPPPAAGALTLTATAGHGFIALSWADAGPTAGTTYTVQRELSPGSTFVTPSNFSGPATGLTGTTFNDYPNGSGVNQSAPAYGSSYFYKVRSSTGEVSQVTSAAVALTGTPASPPVEFGSQQMGSPVQPLGPTNAPAPFAASSSGVLYAYTVNRTGTANPSIKLTLTLDHAPVAADLQRVTFNENGGDQIYTLTAAQTAAAVTVSGNTLTFDSSLLSGANALSPAIPDMIPGGLVTINAYVNANPGSAAILGIAQITTQMPQAGQLNLGGTGNFVSNISDRAN